MQPILQRALCLKTVLACTMFIGVLLTLLLRSGLVAAQGGSSIAQGFKTSDADITAAALVSLSAESHHEINLSTSKNAERLVGVVSNQPLIELFDGAADSTVTVQVVTEGLTMTLVSNINGDIRAGDKITASPIAGVGMKAEGRATVVGVAQAHLSDVDTDTRTIKDSGGKDRRVRIGLLPVQVSIGYYVPPTQDSDLVPPLLQNIADNLSGKNVSPMRIIVASLVFLLLFVSVTVLLYSAVRTSITSIGRNPLSEGAVRKSLGQVAVTVLIMMLFAMAIIYLVLTL